MITARRFVTLAELPDGRWLYKEHGRYYRRLSSALSVIRAYDAHVAQGGRVKVVTHITYEPCSDEGAELVKRFVAQKAITADNRRQFK